MQALTDVLNWISTQLGHEIPGDTSSAFYALFHVILLWAPLALFLVLLLGGVRAVLRFARRFLKKANALTQSGLPTSVFQLIFRHTRRDQLYLVILGLISLPVLHDARASKAHHQQGY